MRLRYCKDCVTAEEMKNIQLREIINNLKENNTPSAFNEETTQGWEMTVALDALDELLGTEYAENAPAQIWAYYEPGTDEYLMMPDDFDERIDFLDDMNYKFRDYISRVVTDVEALLGN